MAGYCLNSRNTKNTANPLFEPFNLQNSILLDNTATTAGNAIYFAHSPTSSVTDIDATMDHNLIGEEVADIGAGSLGSGLTGTYTDLPFTDATNATLTNTIEESPAAEVFASITASETNYLRLAAASPAANEGNNDYLNNGTPDNTEDDLTTDLAGDARIQAGTVDPRGRMKATSKWRRTSPSRWRPPPRRAITFLWQPHRVLVCR